MSSMPGEPPTDASTGTSTDTVTADRHAPRWTGGLASLWRVCIALFALVLGVQALLARLDGAWWPAPLPPAALPTTVIWCGLAVALVLGLAARSITLPLALCILFGGEPAIAGRGHGLLIGLLVLAGTLPPAPYGSWPARGRVDPGGGWFLPSHTRTLVWMGLCLAWLHVAWSLLTGPGFGTGGSIAAIAGYLRGEVAVPPPWPLVTEYVVFAVAAVFVPLSLAAPSRRLGWILATLTQCIALPAIGAPGYSIAMILLHGLAFDPAWLPAQGVSIAVVYYDGNCGLCHRALRFLLAEDSSGTLRFAALQGETFAQRVNADIDVPDSLVVQTTDGQLLWKAAAVRLLLSRLGGGWRAIGWLVRLVPLPIADAIYSGIARIRHAVFARPKTSCPLLPPDLKSRFLP